MRIKAVSCSCRLICGLLAAVMPGCHGFSDEIDDYVRVEMRARRIPGVALAVIQNGKTIKAQGYGLASVELGAPVTQDSVFDIASLTKPFTATAVLLLVEDGRVRLGDSITRLLSNAPPAWSNITVRHLLTHTGGFAGLKNSFHGDSGKIPDGGLWVEYTRSALFDAVRRRPLDFAAGERWQYSDEGYFLLGMIIEKASGKRYHEFLSQRIFRPLMMTNSSVIDQWAIVTNRVSGYLLRDGKLAPNRRIWQIELQSYGGMLSTVNDLAKWHTALQEGRLLKKETLEQMQAPARLNDDSRLRYGFGWFLSEYRGQKVVEHSGSTGTHIVSVPDAHVTVILLTNLDEKSGSDPGKIAGWVASKALARARPSTP